MKTKIPFDIALAMKAWQKPDNNGVRYELYTRDERKVIPSRNRGYYWHYPFKAKIQGDLPLEQTSPEYWKEDGYYLGNSEPHDNDLQLYKIEED